MSLHVTFNNEQTKIPIDDRTAALMRRCLERAAQLERVTTGEVSVTLLNDTAIQQLNRQYRHVDRPTDVLAFPMGDDSDAFEWTEESGFVPLLGDIFISAPRARAQAQAYGHSFSRELGFLLTHGFLHLLGYDHDTEQAEHEMIRKQEQVLSSIGLVR